MRQYVEKLHRHVMLPFSRAIPSSKLYNTCLSLGILLRTMSFNFVGVSLTALDTPLRYPGRGKVVSLQIREGVVAQCFIGPGFRLT
jgi:hypothetical protein